MPNESAAFLVICLLGGGILSLIVLFVLSGIGKHPGSTGRIPPARSFYLEQEQAMECVRVVLHSALLGCRWRITYDRAGEGRLQARVYGTPTGSTGKQPVDILLNMLFHKLDSSTTEVEWSYVVMSGKSEDADLLVDESNRSFAESLTAMAVVSASGSV
ncbi:hypothetical protein BH11CYA1_BH11CYA1_04240 [soil metagenome]